MYVATKDANSQLVSFGEMQVIVERIIDYTAASSDASLVLGDDWEADLATAFKSCS